MKDPEQYNLFGEPEAEIPKDLAAKPVLDEAKQESGRGLEYDDEKPYAMPKLSLEDINKMRRRNNLPPLKASNYFK